MELQNLVNELDCDFIAKSEAWLNDSVCDSEILDSKYTLHIGMIELTPRQIYGGSSRSKPHPSCCQILKK